MDNKIILERFQSVSITISNEHLEKLSSLAKEANQTENELINTFIEYGLNNSRLI